MWSSMSTFQWIMVAAFVVIWLTISNLLGKISDSLETIASSSQAVVSDLRDIRIEFDIDGRTWRSQQPETKPK